MAKPFRITEGPGKASGKGVFGFSSSAAINRALGNVVEHSRTDGQGALMMRRLIVALTGASGAIYGVRALEILKPMEDVETHAILTPAALRTITEETERKIDEVRALADRIYDHRDIGAAVSSGSYQTIGMLVAPCSVRALSGIANCYDGDLIIRAADVCLKERRPVVLLFRETPLHSGHIALMHRASSSGAIVMPPVPAFYHRPNTLDDVINQTVGRALDLFGIDAKVVKRWTEDTCKAENAPKA
jgi:flavin prenyltransferase